MNERNQRLEKLKNAYEFYKLKAKECPTEKGKAEFNKNAKTFLTMYKELLES